MKILGIDFETANNERPSPCSIGIYLKELFANEPIINKEILINPEDYFDDFNITIHGITEEMVENAPKFPEIMRYLNSLLPDDNSVVIAHNAAFDMNILVKSCGKYKLSIPDFTFMDTLAIARRMAKLESYKLTAVADYFGLPKFNHHRAGADAEVCALIFEKFMEKGGFSNYFKMAEAIGLTAGKVKNGAYFPCGKTKRNKGEKNQ